MIGPDAMPGPAGWTFLAFLFVLLPWMAIRSARVLRAMRERQLAGGVPAARPQPSRVGILLNTLLSLGLLFVITWLAASHEGVALFAVPRLGARELLWGALAMAVCLALRQVVSASRSADERRRSANRAWLPRTPVERLLYATVAVAAGVAEESAYRGLAPTLLAPVVGGPWVAALLSAVAFALGHYAQGAKSMAAIVGIALVMQALVGLTGTLVIAMVVHAVYDWIAGFLSTRRMLREEAAEVARAAAIAPATERTP